MVIRSRISSIREKAEIDKLLLQAEMKALHAQMNPHFIFNSLNSIREMVLNQETKEASIFLGKFAHLVRMTLDHSDQSFISLRQTIEYLERYIAMEKIRNEYFTFQIQTDPGLDMDETILPPMLIQPLIENAIWHGTTPDNKQIDISVEFRKSGDQLACIVQDNGIGIAQSQAQHHEAVAEHKPMGMMNIQNRIALINRKYHIQSSFVVEDLAAQGRHGEYGTRVSIRLPLEIKST